jgi:hypothetical protein
MSSRARVALVVKPMTDEATEKTPRSVLSSLMVTLFGGKRRRVQEHVELLTSSGYPEVYWYDCDLSIYKIVVAHLNKGLSKLEGKNED